MDGHLTKGWLIRKPDKLPQKAPTNQRLGKPDNLSQGTHSQTSYPRVQQENTLNKKGTAAPQRRGRTGEQEEQGRKRKEQGHGECKVIKSG